MQSRNQNNARGIDVSHYQGKIDWLKVRDSGISFAFIKSTEGTNLIDDRLSDNVHGARTANVAVGVYHFLRAGTDTEAISEANHFISAINDIGGFGVLDLPPVVDVEDAGNTASASLAFINHLKEVTGLQAIVYTYPSFIDEKLGSKLSDVPLWYASYGTDQPQDKGGWSHWTFLQYSDKGKVPGISGPVDLNEFSGSEGGWNTLGILPMKAEDANKIIAFLKAAYGSTGDAEAHTEIKRLGNEMRRVSNQPQQ